MKIASSLGLSDERFCKMATRTKMLFSNILGHSAELHYETFFKNKGIKYSIGPTDAHYDFIIGNDRQQVKRFETVSTNEKRIGVNLTKTHGNRRGPDAFYRREDFDSLVIFDVGFKKPIYIKKSDIPKNKKYNDRMPRKFKLKRSDETKLNKKDAMFLKVMKQKNVNFVDAIEDYRKENSWTYIELLENCCNLSLDEIDSLFSKNNFRLITGVKGFAAEEHLNIMLEERNIPYQQNRDMYSKVDHWVKDTIRVQVKTPHGRSCRKNKWGVKLHKSHGHGKGELCPGEAFDILALFTGFKMDESYSKYLPIEVKQEFLFVPMDELPRHPKFEDCLKRIAVIDERKFKINDFDIFDNFETKQNNSSLQTSLS